MHRMRCRFAPLRSKGQLNPSPAFTKVAVVKLPVRLQYCPEDSQAST